MNCEKLHFKEDFFAIKEPQKEPTNQQVATRHNHLTPIITTNSRHATEEVAGKAVEVKAGQGFAQGIFIEYGITYDDDVTDVRNGGFGSTTK